MSRVIDENLGDLPSSTYFAKDYWSDYGKPQTLTLEVMREALKAINRASERQFVPAMSLSQMNRVARLAVPLGIARYPLCFGHRLPEDVVLDAERWCRRKQMRRARMERKKRRGWA